jgi:squalene-associated FAD-dependent desaturase
MKRIAVIGGGVAGIKASLELAKASEELEIHLFELRSQLGGRMYSLADKTTGEEIDNGQHLMIGAYDHFLEMVRDFDSEDRLFIQDSLRVDFLSKKSSTTLKTDYLHGKAGMLMGFLMLDVSLMSKIRAMSFFVKFMMGNLSWRDKTAEQLLREHKQGEDLIDIFWRPFILAVFNAQPEQVPAKLLIAVLKRTILAEPENSRLIVPKTGLSGLINSAEKVLKQKGVKLHLGESISSFDKENNEFILASKENEYRFDKVISALAPDALSKLLNANFSDSNIYNKIQNYSHSPISSIYMWFDSNFMKESFVGITDSPIQWIFNRRKLIDTPLDIQEKYPGHITVTISASNEIVNLSKDEIIDLLMKELKEYFPEAEEVKLLHSKILNAKKATILIENDTFRPGVDSGIEGLYLAGDWTDTGLPATLEGAAQSGTLAAKTLLKKN